MTGRDMPKPKPNKRVFPLGKIYLDLFPSPKDGKIAINIFDHNKSDHPILLGKISLGSLAELSSELTTSKRGASYELMTYRQYLTWKRTGKAPRGWGTVRTK